MLKYLVGKKKPIYEFYAYVIFLRSSQKTGCLLHYIPWKCMPFHR